MLNIKANQARKFHKKSYGKLRRKHTLLHAKQEKMRTKNKKKHAKEHEKKRKLERDGTEWLQSEK